MSLPVLGAAAARQQPAYAAMDANTFQKRPRHLYLKRAATGEAEWLTFWKQGGYDVDGYVKACWLLRDVRAGEVIYIDPVLLEILNWMQIYFSQGGEIKPLIITSGYRTPKTNGGLEGAAKNSMHLYGKAVDFRVEGIKSTVVGEVAKSLRLGGVGFYPSSGFTHLDTGRVRSWRG